MPRSRVVFILDVVALALALFALFIELVGGIFVYIGPVRLSARGVDRPVIELAIVVAIRLFLSRAYPFQITPPEWRRRVHRLFQRSADPDDAAARPFSWRHLLMACLGVCLCGAVLLGPQLRDMNSVPDLGDPLLSTWRMGWVYRQLTGDPRPLFDANIFYPERLTFTYSDSMLLPAFTAAPMLAMGIHPMTAYTILFLSGLLFSGLAAYTLAERLTDSPRAAFIAALIFGFYPYHFEHYSHLELQMMQWMPLALIAVHRFIRTAQLRYALAAALCGVAQLYSSMYYGLFFTIYAAAVIAVLIAVARAPWRRLLLPAGIAGVVAIALILPLARPYMAARAIKGERDEPVVRFYSATAADYLRAHQRSALWGTRTLSGRQPERALFPGAMTLGLAAAGLIPPLGLTRLAYATALAVAFDGSLGFNGLTYPYLYKWMMPIRSLRVPARFSVLVALSLSVLAAFGARRLLASQSGRTRTLVFAVLICAVCVDVWPILELRHVWRHPPPIYGAIAGSPSVVLAEFPFDKDFAGNTRFMYFSLWHWASLVNGYSGFSTPAFDELMKTLSSFPDRSAIDALKARGVTHVTVNCAFYRGGCPELIAVLDEMPEFRTITTGLWQGQPVRLYELVR